MSDPERDLAEELQLTQRQLLRYAQDLQALLQVHRSADRELSDTQVQLDYYAQDLRQTLDVKKRLHCELEKAQYETALRLTRAAESREEQLHGHLRRIGLLAVAIGRHLGISDDSLSILEAAAPTHDVGKIAVPDAILLKPGPLDDSEWKVMEQHTITGWEILRGSSSRILQAAAEIAHTHHERWDGSGYPRGLKGLETPLFGRITALVDQYDALRSERPYKAALSHQETCKILLNGDGRSLPEHFQPELLAALRAAEGELAAIFDKTSEGV